MPMLSSPPADAHTAMTYPWSDRCPEPGQVLCVAPGVYWVRMGLPFALDHINLWLLRDCVEGREGWTVVDCGIGDDRTVALWEAVFSAHLDGLPVLRVLVTHMHPDHVGSAGWLVRRWSTPEHECRLWMSATDWCTARLALRDEGGFSGESAARFYESHGMDAATVARVRRRGSFFARLVPSVPDVFRRLLDGMAIPIGGHTWTARVGHGHAPEHISLFCADLKVLISGDMLLPRISTNVSVFAQEPEADPLSLYLASLDRLLALDPDTLVLPSHGRPFVGLVPRVQALHAHHADRLSDLLKACGADEVCAADAIAVLFRRPMDDHDVTFAMGEAVAHLNALWHQGLVRRRRDAHGVWRFSCP